MVWRPPEFLNKVSQARRRAVALWALFLLLSGAAAVAQVAGRAPRLPLVPPVVVGPLAVALPVGWEARLIPMSPEVVATLRKDDIERKLTVRLDRSRYPDPLDYLYADLDGAFSDSPRLVTVAGRPGVMVPQTGEVRRRPTDPTLPFARTVAAASLDAQTMIRVELTRIGPLDSAADAALVRQIAGAVRVDETAVVR